MDLLQIRALVRRHVVAVFLVITLFVAAAYFLEEANSGYQESGTVAFAASQTMEKDALHTYSGSLLAMQDLMSVYMGGPVAEDSVRSAGGSGSYSVTLVNQNNEELPYYKNPYLNIVTSSASPEIAQKTFTAVVDVLTTEVASIQRQAGIKSSKQVSVILSSQPGPPVSQRGSLSRSVVSLGIIGVVASLLTACILDRRRLRPSYRGPQASPGPAG